MEEKQRPGPAGGEGEAAADGAPAAPDSLPYPACEMIDLSGRGLDQLPEHILQMPALQNLYLEGNAISELSEDFFHQLPKLIWLDLRNNKLTSLPLSIGDHRCLKTLLLEGNPIRKLPVELGNLTSLKALNLRKCPIEFPPDTVVHQGLIAILAFLRKPIKIKAEVSGLSAHDTEMPLIEKLQLNVRAESSLDFSDEKERQRFKTLKQKLMQEEKRDGSVPDLDSVQYRNVWGAGFLSASPTIPRAKTPNLKAIFPELTTYDLAIQTKRRNELRLAALKELKEKQTFIEQRKKNQKALKDWRDQAKLMQEKKETERKQRTMHATERNMVVKSAPYATDPNYYRIMRSVDSKRPHVNKRIQRVHSEKEMEEARASKDRELQQRIQQHIKLMRERRKRPKGTPQEELEAAKRELEIATKLQSALARRKIVDNPLESNITEFTGAPLSSTSPVINSQNGISSMKF
ncbi:leucine-rich repeat-containing protein 27-like isoform X1 [Heptranchias perlo]|uniref:leucine-rich repeat-containing protein 27-like isoform X1 n=1 Tax=Heptranchias perlo TaxID=212740 RepID=UPI003559CA6F